MTNGPNKIMSEEARFDIGALQQRVYGLEGGQRSIVETVASLSARVETLFAGLSSKIEERSRPQYPLLISLGIFGLAVLSSVGWLAYAPIREGQTDLKNALVEMTKAVGDRVTIRELDNRSVRSREEMARLNADLTLVEMNLRRSMEVQDAALQRQLDDMKKQYGDTFSLRDAIQMMQRELDRLRSERRGP